MARIQGIAVQPMANGRVRLAFQIMPAAEGGKISDIGSLELRASLKRGEAYLTETWVYRIKL
jgi:glucan biosynthesis protein